MATESDDSSTLTICLGYEPASLYPLAAHSQAARDVLQAIYDGPIDSLNSQPVPVILDDLPSLSNGGVALTPVDVKAGDTVINTAGNPVALRSGTRVFPSGCDTPACAITWDGSSPLQLDQPTATFRLKAGLKWSDGQPLAASDSVYGYRLAADPDSPTNKRAVDQTAAYRALDEVAVEWVGMPGLVTDAYEEYFWMPLPEHAWGSFTAGELLEAVESSRKPLGWGAYRVVEWLPGKEIRLERNPFYFRAGEGLPHFDNLIYKITNPRGDTNIANLKFDRAPFQVYELDIGEQGDDVAKKGCDLVTTTVDFRDQLEVFHILSHYFMQPFIKVFTGLEGETAILFMNTSGQPQQNVGLLAKPEMRQAISKCINRSKIIQELSFGFLELPNPVSLGRLEGSARHIANQQGSASGYDPEAAGAFLDQLGWLRDPTRDGKARLAAGESGITDGTPLQLVYLVEDGPLATAAAQAIKQSLSGCGIGVNIRVIPPESLWDHTSEDSAFSGNFDLLQLSWRSPLENICLLVASSTAENGIHQPNPLNFSRFYDSNLDSLCEQWENARKRAEKQALLAEIEDILASEMPFIPIFFHPKHVVSRSDFCASTDAFSQSPEIVELETFHFQPSCQ